MDKTQVAHFSHNNKNLDVFCAVLHEGSVPDAVLDHAKDAFEALAPYLRNRNQVLYIRDIPLLAIKEKYPGGHCYNPYEAMIALTSWQDDEQQINASIHHELHHMARWQNPGYGDTLGGAILSEGIATYYERLQSGWLSPWANAAFTDEALKEALEDWDNAGYDHNAWFFDGPHGEWVGYGIGFRLAEALFENDFDLAKSIHIEPEEALEYARQLTVR